MKKLVVREIKIFFLLFFLYINKNLSCECCDECWENFYPSKKHSSKYSDKNKELDIPSIIDEEKEKGEKGEEENKSEEEENKPEEEEENKEEENKEENEEENEEERKEYLESLLEDINNVKILKGDFFTEKEKIYERVRELGKGGFGSVYKIQNKKNGNVFALKQIVVKNPDIVKIFQKEIQNMILLRNEKNIVKIFDVYRQDNFVGNFKKKIYSEKDNAVCFYIIMEFCENGDLCEHILKKDIVIKEKDKLAYQIINAVYSCHKEKIAHRDLKSQNIFLDKDWNVKLGDFGLSDNFEYGEKDGLRIGTVSYMCFEKILGREHNPFKADLYSLGVILYELYTNLLYVDVAIFTYKEGKKRFRKEFIYNFYKNENVERNLDNKLDDENLRTLLKGLLINFEKNRCGWNNIFDSEFYKSLKEKFEKN